MSFKLLHTDSKTEARVGKLKTRHGTVETPFFMPVGTKAVGKCIGTDDYLDMGANAIIANAFILSLNPGVDIIKDAGGLNKFMHYNKTIFTDCGGFQMLRQSFLDGTSNQGILFKDPFGGGKMVLTPKKIMDIEMNIGSDVAMVLDDVSPFGSPKEAFMHSLRNTHKWAEECVKTHTDKKQLLFGITQGGTFKDLRVQSAKFLNKLDLDGMAIGGLCIGEPKETMREMVKASIPHIDENKPRYLMGVGSPLDILDCISLGVDCFDSVFPTQNARHGTMFTWNGKLDIARGKYKHDTSPLDEECDCFVCKNFTRSYMHHLMKLGEPVGKRYRSYHNLYLLQRLMEKTRKAIRKNEFKDFKKEFAKKFNKYV